MEKFIAYEKLSKKEQKKLNAAKRGSWGLVKPITKVKNLRRFIIAKRSRILEALLVSKVLLFAFERLASKLIAPL